MSQPIRQLEVMRYDPDTVDEPYFQVFEVPCQDDWVVLDAINYIKENLDRTLSYRWSCHMAVCGSCGMVVNGEPVPYALARFAGKGDFRGNLAKGGSSKGVPLSDRDRWICSQVAPELKKRGILFAGLDVIGDWLSEVNVTSPTGIRELDEEFDLNIAGLLFDAVENNLK